MRKGDIRKQAILDVAERLFYQKGYEQTSVQDILLILKCSKGSFYHHFESKISVLEMLCIQRAEKMHSAYQNAIKPNTPSIDQINRLLYYAMPIRKGEEKFMALLMPMAVKPEGQTLCQIYENALCECFQNEVERAIEIGCDEETFFVPKLDGMGAIIITLMNHFWREIAKTVMAAKHQAEPIDQTMLLPTVELYRYTIGRLLDAPYGAIEIIRLTELCPILDKLLINMRMEG